MAFFQCYAMPVYYRIIGYISRVQGKEVGHIRSPLQSDRNCLQTTVHRPEGISAFLPYYISPWETDKQSRKPQVYHRLWGLLAGRNSSYPQESENSFLRGLLVEWLCFDGRSFGDFASFGPSLLLNFRRGVWGITQHEERCVIYILYCMKPWL